jgi:hypothetical protein
MCGMGCCLIHRHVFEDMLKLYPPTETDKPWFADDIVPVEGVPKSLGEDVSFCRRLNLMGVPIYGNADVVFGHQKWRIEDVDTFLSQGLTEQLPLEGNLIPEPDTGAKP